MHEIICECAKQKNQKGFLTQKLCNVHHQWWCAGGVAMMAGSGSRMQRLTP
jgi:hypothetical protein